MITTSSEEEAHGELDIVHLNVVAPRPRAVTPEVGEVAVVIVADPDTTVHKPVPVAGVFPASVAVVAHTLWSAPAFDTVGGASLVITTSSVEDTHDPLLIVQRSVAEPVTNPVTPDVGEPGVVTDAVPDTTVHKPVPTEGVFPASDVVAAHTV